jgi:hypothetical protein
VADASTQRFAVFLERSLQLIARETPEHFAAVQGRMRGLAVLVGVGAPASVRVQLDVAPWLGPPAHAEVVAEIEPAALRDILDGRLTLEAALEADRLLLRGELGHLLRFIEALEAWIHGAVRCSSMPELLSEYLLRAQDRAAPLREETYACSTH